MTERKLARVCAVRFGRRKNGDWTYLDTNGGVSLCPKLWYRRISAERARDRNSAWAPHARVVAFDLVPVEDCDGE